MISTDQNTDLDRRIDVLARVLRAVLKAARAGSEENTWPECRELEQKVADLEHKLETAPAGEILAAGEALCAALGSCRRDAGRCPCVPLKSLRAMLSVTAHTVAALCANNDDYRARLDEIERQIEETAKFGDGRALRFRLSECLYALRQAGTRQRDMMTQALAQLREQLGQAQIGLKSADFDTQAARDPLTNLEARASAERALADAIDRRKAAHAVAFVVGRVHQVNIRFGYSTGNQVLLLARDHLATHLRPEDRLFRWSGPTFIALIERDPAQQAIEAEVHQITNIHREATVSIGDQAVVIPITFAPLTVPLAQVSDIAELAQKIDRFAGELAHR